MHEKVGGVSAPAEHAMVEADRISPDTHPTLHVSPDQMLDPSPHDVEPATVVRVHCRSHVGACAVPQPPDARHVYTAGVYRGKNPPLHVTGTLHDAPTARFAQAVVLAVPLATESDGCGHTHENVLGVSAIAVHDSDPAGYGVSAIMHAGAHDDPDVMVELPSPHAVAYATLGCVQGLGLHAGAEAVDHEPSRPQVYAAGEFTLEYPAEHTTVTGHDDVGSTTAHAETFTESAWATDSDNGTHWHTGRSPLHVPSCAHARTTHGSDATTDVHDTLTLHVPPGSVVVAHPPLLLYAPYEYATGVARGQ